MTETAHCSERVHWPRFHQKQHQSAACVEQRLQITCYVYYVVVID